VHYRHSAVKVLETTILGDEMDHKAVQSRIIQRQMGNVALRALQNSFDAQLTGKEWEVGLITAFVYTGFRVQDDEIGHQCVHCGAERDFYGVINAMVLDENCPDRAKFNMQSFGPYCNDNAECEQAAFDWMLRI